MKLKNGFVLRDVAGQTVVLPAGDDLDLNLMITLNETGKFLWTLLENDRTEQQLVQALLNEYDVDEQVATHAVADFIVKLKENDFLGG